MLTFLFQIAQIKWNRVLQICVANFKDDAILWTQFFSR